MKRDGRAKPQFQTHRRDAASGAGELGEDRPEARKAGREREVGEGTENVPGEGKPGVCGMEKLGAQAGGALSVNEQEENRGAGEGEEPAWRFGYGEGDSASGDFPGDGGDPDADTREARDVLARYFGFGAFRAGQEEVIENVLSGRDVLLVMPTGGGKSLCYQIPGICRGGLTLVISPLIALMKDQVEGLTRRGVAAVMLNSMQPLEEQREIFTRLFRREVKFLFIAPERLANERFLEMLGRLEISLVAVDEAHCVSQWGHDFRPDYLRIGHALGQLGSPQVVALTATATRRVREDITRHLLMQNPLVLVRGFARPNLEFAVAFCKEEDKEGILLETIRQRGAGIVYCSSRKRVEAVAGVLQSAGVRVEAYHAGLAERQRHLAQDAFVGGKCDVVVATNAFGMGIDRGDVRFVLHYDIPGSIEAYYQEAGRAGRDGLPAFCQLLFSVRDLRIQEFFIEGNNPGVEKIRQGFDYLRQIADGEGAIPSGFTPEALANDLGWKNSMHATTVISELVRVGSLQRQAIPGIRSYGFRLPDLTLASSQLPVDEDGLATKERVDRERLQAMTSLVYATGCRQMWIQEYFGERNLVPCGMCDSCRRLGNALPRQLEGEELVFVVKILSCVARMSKKRRHRGDPWRPVFGREMIQLTLLGSRDDRISRYNLQCLSTYGILRHTDPRELGAVFQSMINAQLLVSTGGERPVITLTELGAEVMTGRKPCVMHWPIGQELAWKPRSVTVGDDTPLAGKTRRAAADGTAAAGRAGKLAGGSRAESAGVPGGSYFDAQLFERFKAIRTELARQHDVAQFQVFTNAVLESLARVKPLDAERARLIHGIGPVKSAKYLQPFIEEIQAFARRQKELRRPGRDAGEE